MCSMYMSRQAGFTSIAEASSAFARLAPPIPIERMPVKVLRVSANTERTQSAPTKPVRRYFFIMVCIPVLACPEDFPDALEGYLLQRSNNLFVRWRTSIHHGE